MVDRSYGVKQSDFTAQTNIISGSYLGFFANGYNYKITYDDFLSGLGVTGSIAQDGAVTGVPVLDVQGTVNYIRNLEEGSGVSINVSPENGIEISHNFTVDTTGESLVQNVSDPSPVIVSLAAGDGISVTTVGQTIEIASLAAALYGQVYMQGNATATVIASITVPVLVAGTWTADLQGSFTASTAGRLTYTGLGENHIRVAVSSTLKPSSGAKQELSLYLAKNGTVIQETRQQSHITAAEDMSISLSWQLLMNTNDYIEVFVQNATSLNNVLVSRIVLSAH